MARHPRVTQKPSTKIGGGDYFDGNLYYDGKLTSLGQMNGAPITKAQYDAAMANQAKQQERAAQFQKDYVEISNKLGFRGGEAAIMAELQKRGYSPAEIDVGAVDENGNRGVPSLRVTTPVSEKSNMMAQIAPPEYELEGLINARPNVIAARREGYDERITRKISGANSSANSAIKYANEAKQKHVDLVATTNRQIGAPEAGAYKGYTNGSINQSYAYAMDKAENGKKSAKKHMAAADNYAKSVQAQANAAGKEVEALQGKSETQTARASRLSLIAAQLAKRGQMQSQTNNAQAQTQGLLNSGPSVMSNLSPMAGNSISDVLKPT